MDGTKVHISQFDFEFECCRDRSLKKMKDEEWNMVLDINWHAIQRLDTALVGDFVASQSLGLDLHDLTHDFGSAAAAASGDGELAVSTGSVEGSLVRPGGSVVVMSSINGIAGAFGQTNYSYTKAALIRYVTQHNNSTTHDTSIMNPSLH